MTDRAQSECGAVLASPAWDRREVARALEFLEPRQSIFLEQLTGLLNRYHEWNRGSSYYDLICGEWLLHFTHVAYAAYLDVVRGTATAAQPSPVRIFADYQEFRQATVENSRFTEELRQQVARLLDRADQGDLQFTQQSLVVGRSTATLRQRLTNSVSHGALARLGSSDAAFVICRPYLKASVPERIRTVWQWRKWARLDDLAYPIEVTASVDREWRRGHSTNAATASAPDLIGALLPLYVPVAYLEAFAEYRQKAHALNLSRPKAIYTAASLHDHLLFKTLVGDWREEGTRLLSHQHGGGYGIDRIHSVERYETRVADRFYTLGWKGDSPRQVPLVGALSASQFRAPRNSRRLLLNCICFPRQVYRFHFHPMPGTIETMIAETAAFVHTMKGRRELVVRPYQFDYGWRMVESLRKAAPGLRLDDSGTGLTSYARSALVVHNYLGTSWLETLALDIPTVCFFDADTYAFRAAAQPYVDDLERVGVLHRSGYEAARFVNRLGDDVEGWWRGADVQSVRGAFVARHANFSPDWRRQWEVEFTRQLEAAS